MGRYFEITDSLASIAKRYPETISLFASNGFPQMEDSKQRESFGNMINFETALKMKQKNPITFLTLLEEAISLERESIDVTVKKTETVEGGINMVGLLPCPVRIPLLEQYESFEKELNKAGIAVNTELKAASMGTDWVKENIENITDPDQLPDLFISAGFDLFFDKKKIGKFRQNGVFKDLVKWDRDNPLFKGRGLKDPDGNYSIISIVPAVFLVNTTELGERDVPKSWEDILEPAFEESVSLPVGDFDLFNAILLNIHNKYGDEGVKKLSRSMLQGMHPAQMVKSNRMKTKKPAVTIMPFFFTKTVKEGGPMVAVWPEDGAIVSPIFMLSKSSRAEELQVLVDFYASEDVAKTLAISGLFPTLHPDVKNTIPADAPLMWIGWDYIKEHDLTDEIEKCDRLFSDIQKEI